MVNRKLIYISMLKNIFNLRTYMAIWLYHIIIQYGHWYNKLTVQMQI